MDLGVPNTAEQVAATILVEPAGIQTRFLPLNLAKQEREGED